MDRRLTILHAMQRVSRALRQEQRLQSAHAAEVAERKRTGHVRGWVPDSVHALKVEFEDELYFLIVAIRQAVASRTLAVEQGATLPPITMEDALVAWRDIYEHWDDAERGVPVRAVRRWTASGAVGAVPGSTMSYSENELVQISGVSLGALRSDLEAVLAVLKDLECRAFDSEWPTPEDAAVFMHMNIEKFKDLARWGVVSMDWSHRDAGLRYQRSSLEEWRAKLIAQDDWPPAP